MIYAKWYHDSIPCMSTSTLVKRLGSLLKAVVDDYKRYQQQLKAGKGELKAVAEYKSLVIGLSGRSSGGAILCQYH